MLRHTVKRSLDAVYPLQCSRQPRINLVLEDDVRLRAGLEGTSGGGKQLLRHGDDSVRVELDDRMVDGGWWMEYGGGGKTTNEIREQMEKAVIKSAVPRQGQ